MHDDDKPPTEMISAMLPMQAGDFDDLLATLLAMKGHEHYLLITVDRHSEHGVVCELHARGLDPETISTLLIDLTATYQKGTA